MLRTLTAVAGCLLLVSCATEEVVGENWTGPRQMLGTPHWPPAAFKADQEGVAGLHCGLGRQREPINCRVVFEYPAGWSFGDYALKMMGDVRIPVAVTTDEIVQPVWFCLERSGCLRTEWEAFTHAYSQQFTPQMDRRLGQDPASR